MSRKPNTNVIGLIAFFSGIIQYLVVILSSYTLVYVSGAVFGLSIGIYYYSLQKKYSLSLVRLLIFTLISTLSFYAAVMVYLRIFPFLSFDSSPHLPFGVYTNSIALLCAGGIGAFILALAFYFLYGKLSLLSFVGTICVGAAMALINTPDSISPPYWFLLFISWQVGVAISLNLHYK